MTNWNHKLAAWLHDPAEKVINLLRDRQGHEHGTVKRLRQELGIRFDVFDHRADHLAAAADRPQWPRKENGGRYQAFEQVNFARKPELVHPLTGDRLPLPPLNDADPEAIKARSLDHFSQLIQSNDPRLTFMAFWRFGPEAALQGELGQLWSMQLADSRVPDHSIWNHLDVVSAIHTALDEGDEPALLAMSFGPVQGFISQARTTSDLWAGSHLLSSLVWEAMKTVVSELGPDAVLFPALRGVPAVDKWLLEQGGEPFCELFKAINSPLLKLADDRNPLFAASLPNKFVAIVPAKRAKALAEAATAAVQQQARNWAEQAARKVFEEAGVAFNDVVASQIRDQLNGFPEAQWAAVTWPVASHNEAAKVEQAAAALRGALAEIHPQLEKSGIFDPQIWQVLSRELAFDGVTFWAPNTGILYPAVYELAERSLAAAKASRTFAPLQQHGYRCSLSGDVEWLTHERTLLGQSREQRKQQSVWGKLKKPAWAKKGEHLGAVATLKRLWPTLFAEQVAAVVGSDVRRYVISTHALALSTAIDNLVRQGIDGPTLQALQAFVNDPANGASDSVTLPASLIRTIRDQAPEALPLLKRLPSAFENSEADADGQYRQQAQIRKIFNDVKPEAYYALILMDGDRMGAWLAGNEAEYGLAYGDSWHSQVKAEVAKLAASHQPLGAYMNAKRPPSPARHVAISRALNDFSTHLARHVVEECCKGKLIYAGGDDVLALVAVDDLFTAMELLRLAYSGIAPHADNPLAAGHIANLEQGHGRKQLLLKNGFGLLDNRLMTLMGRKATASMGVVVAHHTAPLSMVLRELRSAEGQAKSAGRDRFCLRVLKRGGGEVGVTAPWWGSSDLLQGQPEETALRLMSAFAHQLAATDFSRGAIYRAQLWFAGLTDNRADGQDPLWRQQVACSLARQFERQKGAADLAQRVVKYVCDVIRPEHPLSAIESLMVTAEFFAREARGIALKGAAERKQRNGNKEKQPV